MKPHKHAELIKAWADGAEIEYRHTQDGKQWSEWFASVKGDCHWCENDNVEYRIKTKQMSDVAKDVYVQNAVGMAGSSVFMTESLPNKNLRLSFNFYTGELKSAEVIK